MSVAAGATSVIVTAAVAVPLILASGVMAQEALDAAQRVRAEIDQGSWKNLFPASAQGMSDWIERQLTNGGIRNQLITSLAELGRRATSRSVIIVAEAFVVLFFLFYFLRDSARFVRAIPQFLPLSADESHKVLNEVHEMIRAMIWGTLAVALLQGFLGGLMFWWLALPAPMLSGGIMALLSILPLVAPPLVWAPIALYLALTGEMASALALAAWGLLVVGLVDNLLRPVLVKDLVQVHTVPVFIAVLGGVLTFGGSGVLLGPIVLAVAIGLLGVWRRRFAASASIEAAINKS